METKFLGRTGVRVSRLAFGTMTFGAEADERASAAIYARCRDAGINLFDCADVYSKGRAEEILGRLVSGHRDEVLLATKAYFPMGDGPNERGSSRLHLVRSVERSLSRLGTDRIDLFYLHRFDEKTSLEESLRAIDDLVRAGKILYLGVSNFAAWQVQKAIGVAALRGLTAPVAIQPMYNLVKRQAEVELLPMAASESIGVFPYSPLGAGLLTGKYHFGASSSDDRLARSAMYADRYGAEMEREGARRFVEFARERGYSPVALAIAWVAAHPAVTAPLLGARNVEQLEGQLAALEIEMTPELYDAIAALTPTPPPATDRSDERGPNTLDAR
ncbi:MAG: aldo/keto reductase [Myxococcales bacterium]|nr:aldo/keto reductase [Myxococcales bacterium]